jgi:hypothetical protein
MAPHDGAPLPKAEDFQPEGSTAAQGRIPRWGEQSRVLWAIIAVLLVVLLLELSNEFTRHRTTLAAIPKVTASLSAPSDFAGRWALGGIIR